MSTVSRSPPAGSGSGPNQVSRAPRVRAVLAGRCGCTTAACAVGTHDGGGSGGRSTAARTPVRVRCRRLRPTDVGRAGRGADPRYGRRSGALRTVLERILLALAGRAGTRLAVGPGVRVRGTTLIRSVGKGRSSTSDQMGGGVGAGPDESCGVGEGRASSGPADGSGGGPTGAQVRQTWESEDPIEVSSSGRGCATSDQDRGEPTGLRLVVEVLRSRLHGSLRTGEQSPVSAVASVAQEVRVRADEWPACDLRGCEPPASFPTAETGDPCAILPDGLLPLKGLQIRPRPLYPGRRFRVRPNARMEPSRKRHRRCPDAAVNRSADSAGSSESDCPRNPPSDISDVTYIPGESDVELPGRAGG